MKFGLPPWLKRTREPTRELVKYTAPAVLTDAEETNGWTPEGLAEYQAESDARAMAVVATSMDRRLRPRPTRWANNRYSPLHWRG